MNEEGEPPHEWVVSRVCEEFTCLPSEAEREIAQGSFGLVWDILELRAFARAKYDVDNAEAHKTQPTGKMVDEVLDIELENARESMAKDT